MRLFRSSTTVAWVLTGAAVLLSACTTGEAEPEQPAAASPDQSSSIPAAPEPTLPADSVGSLDQSDLPAPEELGTGWDYRIDPGSVEDGYSGSGAPAIARDPAEVVAAITPLGCRPGNLPEPDRALEVTYRKGQILGVGLLLEFADASGAQSFFDEHTETLRNCASRRSPTTKIVLDQPALFVSVRDDGLRGTPTWAEGMRPQGAQVLLLAVADPTAAPDVSRVLS